MKKIYLVVVIIVFGAFLRVYALNKIPSGFFRDEAAISYNAYSLWKTGEDEFGVSYPLVFRSFEVFFLPLYVYLSAPIVGIFGLSVFSARILSAISGIVALIFAFLIAKKIWKRQTGFISVFLLSIVPWHIYYSRAAFEGNLALTLFIAGFYFWIKFLDLKNAKNFFLSTFAFALSMYSYQAERLVVPLFALAALFASKDLIWKTKNKLIIPSIVILVALAPLLSLTAKPGGYHRAFGVSVFSKQETPPGWVNESEDFLFVNNTYFLRARQFLALYLSYFSPKNLYSQGDFDKQRSVEKHSVFYWWMFPFLLLGFYQISKTKKKKERLLLAWTFLAPLPASFSSDPFHTYRALLLFMPLTMIHARGLQSAYIFLMDKKLKVPVLDYKKPFIVITFLLLSFASLSYFAFYYAVVNKTTRARYWDYGYAEIVDFVAKQPDKKVVIDDPLSEAYIHYLFFKKLDPNIYHAEVEKLGKASEYYYNDPKQIRPEKVQNVEFREVDWPKERGDSGTIFIIWHKLLPDSEFVNDPNVRLLKEIKYPSGETAYKIVEII